MLAMVREQQAQSLWSKLGAEVADIAAYEPVLRDYLRRSVLEQPSVAASLCYLLAGKLANRDVAARPMRDLLREAYQRDPSLDTLLQRDLAAVVARDPASDGLAGPFLNHKGFHALQAYRAAHYYWQQGRTALASFLQSRISEVFAVDINPAAKIGGGVFIDHATGVVIGETAVVGDDVSLLQNVTLGGTGKEHGDRHPKIGRGVLIAAGAIVLGNIRIGDEAKIGAGSVVLNEVAPRTTVVGVPARAVGGSNNRRPSLDMDHCLGCIDES